MNLVFLFSFAADSCPKAPEIANSHVEYSVRYQCDKYYKLSAGDGEPGRMPPGPPIPTLDRLDSLHDCHRHLDHPLSCRALLAPLALGF